MAKIAYVNADSGIPCFGTKGASIHVQQVCRCLLEQGHEVTLFTRRVGGEKPRHLDKIHLRRLPKFKTKGLDREQEAIQSNKQIAEIVFGDDHFDLLYERYSLWSSSCLEKSKQLGVPSILEVNAPLIEEQQKYRSLSFVEEARSISKSAFENASSLVAVSEGVGSYLESLSLGLGSKIHVIPNGVRTDDFQVQSIEASNERLSIGFVGSLKPWHGLDILLHSFSSLLKQRDFVQLDILGDGPERAHLEALAKDLGIDKACRFFGSVLPVDIPKHLADFDIAVAPYPKLENFYFSPLKIFEYMAAGIPVIASRIGQIEHLLNEHTGVLVEPGSKEELLQALIALVDSDSKRKQLGRNARDQAVRKHDWTKTVEQILSTVDFGLVKQKSELEGIHV